VATGIGIIALIVGFALKMASVSSGIMGGGDFNYNLRNNEVLDRFTRYWKVYNFRNYLSHIDMARL